MPPAPQSRRSLASKFRQYFFMIFGAILAAFSIEIFLIPHNLIDGGVVGISMILAYIFGHWMLSVSLILINFPFIFLAYRYIGKGILLNMLFSVLVFVGANTLIYNYMPWHFQGESLEVVVIGGCILGIGVGLIIRNGGVLDGTEIMGIIINKETGITVGQVVLFCNVFIFTAAGIVFQDWHPPILSLITFMVATKVMDAVIVGLDETKSVTIISPRSKQICSSIINDLGLGVTILYGRGGYSGAETEILYVIAERIQLSELKETAYQIDPSAFIAIENLHEVASGNHGSRQRRQKKKIENLVKRILTRRRKQLNSTS